MKWARATDANHSDVIKGLRKAGIWCCSLHRAGFGIPDILAWHRGRYVLLEVKDGTLPPSARRLTPAEEEFLKGCPGEAYVVNSTVEALERMLGKPLVSGVHER